MILLGAPTGIVGKLCANTMTSVVQMHGTRLVRTRQSCGATARNLISLIAEVAPVVVEKARVAATAPEMERVKVLATVVKRARAAATALETARAKAREA
jgi:hypothetical protein